MTTLAHQVEEGSNGGEPIRFAASSRAEAESLQRKLSGFEPRLSRGEDGWLVEINPGRRLTPLMLHLFNSVSDWLRENRRASVEVFFGESRFTFLHPTDARASHPAEFLLQRVVQLETALESRVAIEQAKGLLAGRLRLAIDEAFELLRAAARGAGRQLHELAEDVVRAEGDLPAEVRKAFETWRRPGRR